jgi:hypothetical protein
MGLLSWLIVGLIAVWLVNQVMRGGRGNTLLCPWLRNATLRSAAWTTRTCLQT